METLVGRRSEVGQRSVGGRSEVGQRSVGPVPTSDRRPTDLGLVVYDRFYSYSHAPSMNFYKNI